MQEYETPDMEVIYFETEDILTASTGLDPDKPGGDWEVDPWG